MYFDNDPDKKSFFCRCQKSYRKSSVEDGQAMQWPIEKGKNDKQWSNKTNYTEN
jgi:hypothetical protein